MRLFVCAAVEYGADKQPACFTFRKAKQALKPHSSSGPGGRSSL